MHVLMVQIIDDEVCYKYSEYSCVFEVFSTRARMFRDVYLHKCGRKPSLRAMGSIHRLY